jgi:predicted transcriptional regulator
MYEAWDAYQQNERQGVLVLNGWQEVMGVLGAEQFSRWQEEQAPADAVSFYYKNQWQAFGPANNLLEVARYLDSNGTEVAPVFDNGRLVGVVTGQRVLQFIRRHSWLKRYFAKS